MSALDQLAENDLVSDAIYDALAVRERRSSRTGFTNICCPLCTSRGQPRPDTKFRCGIKYGSGIGVSCFNCQFRCKWVIGNRLSKNMRQFLEALGVAPREVQKLAYWADTMRVMLGDRPDIQEKLNVSIMLEYPPVDLPPQARSLQYWDDVGCTDPDFLNVIGYLLSRGDIAATATTYYWTPAVEHELNSRLIIPCYQGGNIVGWTARSVVSTTEPRYYNHTPPSLLFNSWVLTAPYRKYIFIVEGVFDALVIDGVSPFGSSLNEAQIALIKQSDKQPIIVPDRDKAGELMVRIALKQNWPVAFMNYGHVQWWDAGIKDAAAAVKAYGKLYTIQSILANLTWDEHKIRQRMMYLADQ